MKKIAPTTTVANNPLTELALRLLETDLVGVVRFQTRTIRWTNRAFDEMFGYQRFELIGQSARVLYTDEESFLEQGKAMYSAIAHGKIYRTERQQRRKDGSTGWFAISLQALHDDPMDAVAVFSDVTEFRQLQQQGATLLFELARLVETYKTMPLTNTRELREQNNRARALTPRQREILKWIAAGLTSSQIARKLNISPATAATHRKNLMQTLNVKNIAELLTVARKQQLLPNDYSQLSIKT